MTDEHPARAAGLASQAAVRARRKETWLDLFAADGCVEDPIGPSGFDPEGAGHHGREAIARFWDMSIAKTESIEFLFTDSFACGNEVAFVGTIRTRIAGQIIDADGAFTYRVDETGKIRNLRAYWETTRALKTARPQ